MEKTRTHWRTLLNTKYLNGDEIPKDGVVVTIVGFTKEDIFSQKSKEKEEHVTLKFKQFDKPMILTNRKAKQISKVLESSIVEDWINKTITIHPVQEKHFGEWFPVINVKAGEIKKEVFNSKHPRWNGACESLAKGESTIEAIEKYYTLTPAVKKELESKIPK